MSTAERSDERTHSNVPKVMFYEGSSDGGFPEANYYHSTFNSFPQHFYNDSDHLLTTKFHDYIKEKYLSQVIWSTRYLVKKDMIHNNILYQLNDQPILIKIHAYAEYGSDKEHQDIYKDNIHVHVYFHEWNEILEDIVAAAKRFSVKKGNKGNKISLVINDRNGSLTTKEFDIKIGTVDIGMNYGDDFVPVYNKIIRRLNSKKDKGLVLFHGKPGTGKSSLIKYIAKNLKKEVMFIPPHMAESISSPGFIPFLTSHNNSVLIIEDAERIISSRNNNMGSEGVSNILNISDGILGDCLGIQIIATFNTSRNNIDEALLRKGRLIAEHEFKDLPASNANALFKSLGSLHTTNKPMTLTDIYNISDEEFRTKEIKQTIGFNR